MTTKELKGCCYGHKLTSKLPHRGLTFVQGKNIL